MKTESKIIEELADKIGVAIMNRSDRMATARACYTIMLEHFDSCPDISRRFFDKNNPHHEWVYVGEQIVEDCEMCVNCKQIRKRKE